MKPVNILKNPDIRAVLVLTGLWLLFFWRLFTPNAADQASLEKGDFSGQFVAFAGYQYQRFAAGEVPLWNPYNNGGLPFIADTQAAVFYPPRLVTIALSNLSGGWTYHALELEMTFHVLAYSLLMYLLMRRMTLKSPGSVVSGLITAITAAYGGFLTGYPPLQLALLEAGVWLPLAVLGILEATRSDKIKWSWLTVTGLALGLSWMAGHPQTSWFLSYLLVACLAYRVYIKRYHGGVFLVGVVMFGGLAGGLAAVQLLPGVEYLPRTARIGLGYDAKGNGFPIRDLVQFGFPGIVSLWSPLYVGIVSLTLAIISVWRRVPGSAFWGAVGVIALGLSFGANSAVFPALYNLLPGLNFFRGQERAAYLVANSLAILAGLGFAHLAIWDAEKWPTASKNLRRIFISISGVFSAAVVIIFNEWLNNNEGLNQTLSVALFGVVIAALLLFLGWEITKRPQITIYHWLLVTLIVFELFTVNMDTESNFDSIPPSEQIPMSPPGAIEIVLADSDVPFRVDGFRGLHDNFGSLYGVMDMRGISPLFLEQPYMLINPELINPLAWELFAVRYVYTDWGQMPVPSDIVGEGIDRYGTFNIHKLNDPRPFAHLVYDVSVVDSDAFALALLHDPNFDPRKTIILNTDPKLPSIQADSDTGTAVVTEFRPEQFTIEVDTPQQSVLSVSQPDYPGWEATIDGEPIPIMRAYGMLAAVVVPEGQHSISFHYNPISYRIGAIISLIAWGGLLLLGAGSLFKNRDAYDRH